MTEIEFKAIIMPLTSRMFSLARSILADNDEAADCVQETLTKLWDARQRLTDVDNIQAYALTIVRREALDCIRKGQRSVSFDQSSFNDISDNSYSERRIDDTDTLRDLRTTLGSLPPQQHRVVELSGISGLSNVEIETVTGLSPQNVRSLLCRGRKRLRQILSDCHKSTVE